MPRKRGLSTKTWNATTDVRIANMIVLGTRDLCKERMTRAGTTLTIML